MIRSSILAGVAALAVSAVAAQAQPRPYAPGGGAAPPAPEFVAKAGASDKFEITEANLALARSHNPRVKSFAREMVRDHTQSTMKVKAAARRVMGHNPPPPMLNPDQQRMVADLRASHGPDFDRTYLDQQVQAHQQALDLMQAYSSGGDAPPLRQAATEITPVVQHHLDMAKDMHDHMR